jgi:hypothetical protein
MFICTTAAIACACSAAVLLQTNTSQPRLSDPTDAMGSQIRRGQAVEGCDPANIRYISTYYSVAHTHISALLHHCMYCLYEGQ